MLAVWPWRRVGARPRGLAAGLVVVAMATAGGRALAQIGSALPDEPPVAPARTDAATAPVSAPPSVLPTGSRAAEVEPPVADAPSPSPSRPSPSSPLPPPSSAEAAPPLAAPVAPVATDGARLDEIEQLARIAARKQELTDEKSIKWDEAAKRIESAPVTQVDDNGFSLKLPDGSYALRLRALVQADGRGFFDDDALQATDTFLIRRFRPSLEGTLFGLVDYRLLPELAGTVQLLDAYTDIHPWAWLRVRVGRFKGPIGLERLQSDADLPLLERALDSNLSSVRELGVQLWGDVAGGVAQYAVALFNGSVDGANADTDFNHAKDLAARLFFQPLRIAALADGGSLGIGIAASFGNRKGKLPTTSAGVTSVVTGLPSFRSAGQNTFFQYLAPTDTTGASTVFTHQLTWHLNPQLSYYYETVGLLAEYVVEGQGVQKGNTTTTLTNQAAHATLSYVFNGKVGFDGVTPTVGFDRKLGAPGAFELAVRWDWLRVDPAAFGGAGGASASAVEYADPSRSARSAQGWTAGFTWVPRRSVHLAIDFGQTSFTGGAGTTSAPVDRKTENVLIARSQVNF